MKNFILILILISFCAETASAHHGVASLGVAGLLGPGAPIETSNSATLPEGSFFAYLKLDRASYKNYTTARDDESKTDDFWIYGTGYGITPYFSLYLFLPYYSKRLENSFTTSGFADISVTAVLGFKYDEGFILVPKKESLDDLMDWHFTIYGGLTIPTGNSGLKDSGNNLIDPGMQLGFGRPSYTFGFTATKQVSGRFTTVADLSYLTFMKYKYDDGVMRKFGDEFRANAAVTGMIFTSIKNKFRIDGNLEVNYLRLGRDEENDIGQDATGGHIVYLLPGLRVFYKSSSIGFGVKFPVWTKLNESGVQQGAEGKEKYRLIFTFSMLV